MTVRKRRERDLSRLNAPKFKKWKTWEPEDFVYGKVTGVKDEDKYGMKFSVKIEDMQLSNNEGEYVIEVGDTIQLGGKAIMDCWEGNESVIPSADTFKIGDNVEFFFNGQLTTKSGDTFNEILVTPDSEEDSEIEQEDDL